MKLYRIILLLVFTNMLCHKIAWGQLTTENYVKTYKATVALTGDLTGVNDKTKVVEEVSYLNGLGVPVQTVKKQATPLGYDFVSFQMFDEYGRITKSYLPYATTATNGNSKSSLVTSQSAFYQNLVGASDGVNAFSVSRPEDSELNRIIKQGAPGLSWQPDPTNTYNSTDNTVKYGYESNDANEVLLWTFQTPTEEYTATAVNAYGKVNAGTALTPIYYAANRLSKQKTKDEAGNQVIEYADKEGRIILKRVQASAGSPSTTDANKDVNFASTYYVYDDLGNLTCVIPPEATTRLVAEYFQAGATDVTKNDFLKRWAFRYRYDGRNRMILKQVPGAEPIYMVYDNRDRLILTQDGNQRTGATNAIKFWSFTKYDQLNRPISSGIKDTTTTVQLTQALMQSAVNNHFAKASAKWSETYVGNVVGNVHGYTNKAYPVRTGAATEVDANKYLTVTYYDNYSFRDLWYGTYTYSNESLSETANGITYTQPTTENLRVIGQVTGTKTKVLDGISKAGGAVWLRSVNYYDDKYRVVQSYSDNIKGGMDRVTSVYDFVGKVLKSKSSQDIAYDVVWSEINNLILQNKRLYKPTSVAQGNGNNSAVSLNTLSANQDGWVEFTIDNLGLADYYGHEFLFAGLTTNKNNAITSGYVFYLISDNTLSLYANGIRPISVIGYNKGDVFRISREGTDIKYYHNYKLIYTATGAPTVAMVMDIDVNKWDCGVVNARSSFGGSGVNQQVSNSITRKFEYDHAGRLVKTYHAASQNVAWDNLTEVTLTDGGNLLYKSGASGGLGGADSKQIIPDGMDGWVETEVKQVNLDRMIGLSYITNNTADGSLDYCIFLRYTGQIQINEGGVSKGTFGAYSMGDRVKVVRENNIIRYYKNDLLFYTSLTPASGAMKVDSYFSNNASNLYKTTMGVSVLLALNQYNELGQLVDKKLHSTVSTGANAKQSVDYRYNIRGWLTSMNDASLANTTSTTKTNDDTGDLFGMNLAYNETTLGIGNTGLFNGNISGMTWSTNLGLGTTKQNAYVYSYDKLNRILSSTFKEKTTTWSAPANSAVAETGFTYDLNGNILTLQRNDKRASGWMDNLGYTYTGNQLQRVIDTGDDFAGFFDGNSNTGNDYTYDANGNMTRDLNKGIGTSLTDPTNIITYNYLNLPETVTKGGNNIRYIYDASGRKLSQVTTFGSQQKQTDYVGEYQYENDQLQFISHEEGRIAIASNKTIVAHSGDALANVTAATATLAVVTEYGNTYVRATANGTTLRQGIFPIGGTLSVQPGEQYRIRAKGYRPGVFAVYILVRTNNTDLNWPGAQLANSLATEGYSEQLITIPAGHTTLQVGLVWDNVGAGQQFFLNDFEITKLSTNTTPEYQYNLKDHLGNVRLTFTATPPPPDVYTATYEDANSTAESAIFNPSYNTAVRLSSALYNHTAGGSKSQRLSAANANEVIGLTKSLKVIPGDTVNMEVWAKYFTPTTTNSNVAGSIFASFASAFGVSAASTGDGAALYNSLTAMNNVGALFNTGSGVDPNRPKGYINYILFDEKYVPYDFGFTQIPQNALETGGGVPHQLMQLQAVAKEPGYAYIYLSNENDKIVDVFFDDLKITHRHGPVVQSDSYYPFGLTFNSYNRENNLADQYLYNGKEKQDELGLDWLDYGARLYDPTCACWHNVDPVADAYYSNSPYTYVLGNPVSNKDEHGMWTVSRHHRMTLDALSSVGIGGEQARLIAHYASVYADNPGSSHLLLNNLASIGREESLNYRYGMDYSGTANSQKTGYAGVGYNYNIWHSMRSGTEKNAYDKGVKPLGISARNAMLRGLRFGWDKVFESAEGGTLANLKEGSSSIQAFGQGLHALQDAYAHEGRHDVGADHILNDVYGDTKQSESISQSAVVVHKLLTNDFTGLQSNHLNIVTEGMSSAQVSAVLKQIGQYFNYLNQRKKKDEDKK